MLKIVALYLCWTVFLVSGDGNASPKVVDTTSSIQPPVDVKDAKIIPEPIKTTVPPVTTTVKPDTTTPVPITTTVTPAPTTPVPDNVTTTIAPNVTTTVAPDTTTLSPVTTPAPAPKTGHWVFNSTNATCIVVQMSVQFDVTYWTKDNKTEHQLLTLPTEKNATVTGGDCGANEQNITISWNGGNNSLALHFVKNDTTKKYYMHHLEVSLSANDFPNIKSNATLKLVHEPEQFATGFDHSYRCMKEQTLALSMNGTSPNSTLSSIEISELQFEAFKTDKAGNFGVAQDCQSSDVPDVVPIVVGCVLTALVIMVLAAYLVGRRRSQARGYLSM